MLELRDCGNWALPMKHMEHSVLYHVNMRCVSAGSWPQQITQLVYRYRHILICLWGVERVVYHRCQPRENFFTPLFFTAALRSRKVSLTSDWHVVCQLLPDTKCLITPTASQRAYKSLIDIQSACKQVSKAAWIWNQTDRVSTIVGLVSDQRIVHTFAVSGCWFHRPKACNLLPSTAVTQRATLWALSKKNGTVIVYVFIAFTLSWAVSQTACLCFLDKGSRSDHEKWLDALAFFPPYK